MLSNRALNSLAYALVSAVQTDLEGFDANGENAVPRRPSESDCDVYHFPQVWGSTALGFGGVGGQALTTAYTTVIVGPQADACVYFDGRLAYRIDRPNQRFYRDLQQHGMASVNASVKRYQQEATISD